MATTYREVGTYCSVVLLMLVSLGACDIAKDRQECATQLVGLSTCLPYVSNQAKAPTMDCCTGLNQVIKNNMKCLCILVKDRNDPSVGLKINATLALGLPAKCKAPNHDISECPALLHLAPNSPESKVFTDFGKAAAPATPGSTAKPLDSVSAPVTMGPSIGGTGKKGLTIQLFYGVLLWSFTFHYVF